jgi:hypothetical protein
MAPHTNEVRIFVVGGVQDRFDDRAIGYTRPRLYTLLAELSLYGSQIGLCFFRPSAGFSHKQIDVHGKIRRLDNSQEDHLGLVAIGKLLRVRQDHLCSL